MRQSQGRSGSTCRFPGLLMHGTIRGDTLEGQGELLNVLLILEEETGRPLDGNGISTQCTSAAVSASL